MSIRTTATFNAPLTAYAYGLMQDQLAAYDLANTICPIVQVGSAVGTFKKHDDRNSFAAPPTARAISGPRNRIQHDDTDGTYACKPQGLEIGLDDFEGELGGEFQNAEQLAQLKIRTLTSQKCTSYAKRVVDFAFANITPTPNRGNWDNPDVDPIDQIDEMLDGLALDVGTTENISLIMSTSEWRGLRSNAKVKARLGLKDDLSLTREKLTAGLLYPVNLKISGVVYTSTKRGQTTVAKSRITAGYCMALLSKPVVSQDDASAFKCFSTNSVLLGNIMQYRDESSNSTIYKSDWSEDIQKTGSACVRSMAVTLPQ